MRILLHIVKNAHTSARARLQCVTVLIGPDTGARLVEAGVLAVDDNEYVIHPMHARNMYARPKYLRWSCRSSG